MNISTRRAADNLSHIEQIMRRVKQSEWSPFKLHEIITLERCLQECSSSDPQFNVILRKLDNEVYFVEPSRRVQHLARTKQDEQDDIQYKRASLELRERIELMNDDIWFYQLKLDQMVDDENKMHAKISQLEKSFSSLNRDCKLLTDEFSLLLQRVYNSFESSLFIIQQQIPIYLSSISKSKLVQQTGALPLLYKKCLLRLIKKKQDPTNVSYNFKLLARPHYTDYLAALIHLYRDLALLDKVYSGEISTELEHIRALEQHINNLETPIKASIRKTIYRYPSSSTFSSSSVDSVVDLSLVVSHTAGKQSEVTDDPELINLFSSISKYCKVLSSS